jgi:hypothetical protein
VIGLLFSALWHTALVGIDGFTLWALLTGRLRYIPKDKS